MDTRTGEIHDFPYEKMMEHMDSIDRKYMMQLNPTLEQTEKRKVGRNEPCPCGSGKKFKRCHLGKPA